MFPRTVRDKIIIKQSVGNTEVAGIQIATAHQVKLKKGIIMACNEKYFYPNGTEEILSCKVGDLVQYQEFAGAEVEIDGEPYVVVKYDDLHFIL